mgnify:CR=1 FL=1
MYPQGRFSDTLTLSPPGVQILPTIAEVASKFIHISLYHYLYVIIKSIKTNYILIYISECHIERLYFGAFF